MSFNKLNNLNNLIEKYNLTNIIKVLIILIILYILARLFIPDYSIIKQLSTSEIEPFENLNNGNIYGNVISLKNTQNTPLYVGNTCILELDNIYRIDTLKFKFNTFKNSYTKENINIKFQDSNDNMKYIKSGSITSTESPQNFKSLVSNNILTLDKITDENNAPVYTSKIVLIIGDSSKNISNLKDTTGNGYIKEFGIFGGERNLPMLSEYNGLSNTLSIMNFIKNDNQPSNTKVYTFTLEKEDDVMIYALQLDFTIIDSSSPTLPSKSTISKLLRTTDMPFNIKIEYYNSIYPNNDFTVNKTYKVRSDANKLSDLTSTFIFLTEPIIANKLMFTIENVNNVNYNGTQKMNITHVSSLVKSLSQTDINDYKKNINYIIQSKDSSLNTNICPNINELVDKQNKTQQICDNLEFQDKTKSEKLRLERNKQYLLKLKNQQEQIDQLNSVIEKLESSRNSRAQTADQVRVLQYQKQKEEASIIRDLANQRLESQDNNKLYLDVKIKN